MLGEAAGGRGADAFSGMGREMSEFKEGRGEDSLLLVGMEVINGVGIGVRIGAGMMVGIIVGRRRLGR